MAQHKYAIIADKLREEIRSGRYKQGEKFATELELTERFGVSRQTVRQALSQLSSEGHLVQRQGSGTYVSELKKKQKNEQTMTIGVLCSYISNYIFPSLIRGIEQELSANGYGMRLAATENRLDNEAVQLRRYLENPVDGLIVEGTKTTLPNPNIHLYRELISRGIPLVFLHAGYPELSDKVLVGMQEEEGGRMAVEYLISKGHTRITGIFKSDDRQGLQRYSGFNEGLRHAGLAIDDSQVKWYTTEDWNCSGYFREGSWIEEFLSDATAVVCYNDQAAVWLVRQLAERGIGVPQDMLVVSFDQSSYYEMSGLKIVSFSHRKEEIGRIAAQKILRLIQGEAETSVRLEWGKPDFVL